MQNSTIKGIQMIGTQRSGSNLLRLMLNQLPEVFAPHPPHVFVVFFPLLPFYGNLEDDTNFKNLLNDVCTLIELNPVPWSEVDLNRETLFNMCANRSLLEIFVKINELQCMEKGKTTWCCKSLETVYFIQNFKREHFSPFVIYLVRDGRDVAVSFKKAIIGEKHIYHLAQKWKKDQELAISYIEQTPKDKYTILKYEDFILEPEKHIKNICDLTGMHYAPNVMDYYESDESKKTADSGKMWENVAKPVMKDNTKKYKASLSEDELNIFEVVAGHILDKFGYEREIKNPHNGFSPDEIKGFDAENDRLKKEALQNASEKDREKRKPQKDFIESLTRKLSQAQS